MGGGGYGWQSLREVAIKFRLWNWEGHKSLKDVAGGHKSF